MEGMGPEPKRQRMEYNGPQRLPPQPPPPPSSHGHPSTLPPPLPPSFYDPGAHDPRNLPDPSPHAYVQEHSGHSTPIREPRYHPDPNYSRRNSSSAARSPDGPHQHQSARSMSVATTAEGQHYPSQYNVDAGSQPGYISHEATTNGTIHHGLPSHPYEQAHSYPSSHPMEYAHSPANTGPTSYGSLNPYAVQFGHGSSRPMKKGNRATQVCLKQLACPGLRLIG